MSEEPEVTTSEALKEERERKLREHTKRIQKALEKGKENGKEKTNTT